MDYHVEFDERMYGVPYQLVGKSVEISHPNAFEIYHQGVMADTCGWVFVSGINTGTMPASHQRRWPQPEMMAAWGGTSKHRLNKAIVLSWELSV